VIVKRDFGGDFEGTARITDRTESSASASFTFTAFRGSRQLGTLIGSVTKAALGQTEIVQLISTDNYLAPSRYTFQTDYSF